MEKRVVIITGASRGLGAATARQLSHFGAASVLAARSLDRLQYLAGEIRTSGGEALPVRVDVSRAEDRMHLIDEVLNHYGRIDALINNSGTVEPIGPISDANPEAWEASWAANVLGPVMLAALALPHLRQVNGRIINITSGSTKAAVGGWGAYSTAKAALNQLTRVLAVEEPSIAAIALLPGIMDTEMQEHIRRTGKHRMAEKNYQWLVRLHKTGGLVPPDAPAEAAACLALYAPREWSGEILEWDEPRVKNLIRETFP